MDDKLLTEVYKSKEEIYDGVVIHLERWKVSLPDGSDAYREIASHPGASAVVALDDNGQIILVRQHRIAVGRLTWEIPAGKLDHPGEDPLECAKRELSEETGLEAANWQKLTTLETTPGFCNEQIHIYLATNLKQGATHPDEDEFVSVGKCPLQEALRDVMNGTIRDAKTAVGILMASQMDR